MCMDFISQKKNQGHDELLQFKQKNTEKGVQRNYQITIYSNLSCFCITDEKLQRRFLPVSSSADFFPLQADKLGHRAALHDFIQSLIPSWQTAIV